MKTLQIPQLITLKCSKSFKGIIQPLLLLILFSFIPIAALAFQSKPQTEIDLRKIEFLADSVANNIIGIEEVPGMAVAVAQDGKIIFRKNYGQSDIEMNVEVNDSTIFNLASITKQFTAATIMRLIDQGKISLDDPITKFFPDYPTNGNIVTVHHLLNHTSGTKTYTLNNAELPGWYSLDLSYQQMMGLWGNKPFDFKPGENYDYNNWGYYLLGQIIEIVTGKPWSQYGEPELLKPLGLNKTIFAHQTRIVPQRAKGYIHQKDSIINVPYRNILTFSAGGGLSSTIDELVKWTHLLHSGKVVSAESLRKMTTPTQLKDGKTVGYGYGLYVDKLGDYEKIYHGGTFGFGTYASYYPEKNIIIAILTNSTKGRGKAEELEKILATEALDIPITIKDLPLSAADIDRYSGVYTYQSNPTTVGELTILGENGDLKARFGNNKPFLLRYQGGNKFIPDARGITNINFEVEENRVVGLTIHEGAYDITKAKRK